MINEIIWRRILFMAIGLITSVVGILAVSVIPHVLSEVSPSYAKGAATGISVIAFIHLLIIVALIWTIRVKNRGGQINKELLVAAGVIPIVLSLLILDGAFAYIDTPGMHGVSILMMICVGCDFVAGLLALFARYFRRPKPL